MKTIGIDIGTTTISAVVMETEGRKLLASRTIPNGSFIQTDREWERIQDVSLLMNKAKELLDSFLEEFPDTKAIGLTGQMHGMLYTDAAGRCVSPLYTWEDGSGHGLWAGDLPLSCEKRAGSGGERLSVYDIRLSGNVAYRKKKASCPCRQRGKPWFL